MKLSVLMPSGELGVMAIVTGNGNWVHIKDTPGELNIPFSSPNRVGSWRATLATTTSTEGQAGCAQPWGAAINAAIKDIHEIDVFSKA